jgi:hypothetical protein
VTEANDEMFVFQVVSNAVADFLNMFSKWFRSTKTKPRDVKTSPPER